MKFTQKTEDFQYTLVSVNMYGSNLMRSGHYYCDILDFNTGIWWRFDDDTTNKLAGLPDNVYSVQ